MQAKLIIAAVILVLIAAGGGITYLYMQAKIERDLAKSETKVVEQGYRAAIEHWQEDAETKAKQIEVLNEGYAKARSEQSDAEKYLSEHKLAEAIERKAELVDTVFNHMAAGLLNSISDATNRPTSSTSNVKTSKAGRNETVNP